MAKPVTLNRFPLFGLFAYRAARRLGYREEQARLLGYSTALLFAIYKAKAGKPKEVKPAKPTREGRAAVKAETVSFGGQDFAVERDAAGDIARAIIAGEPQTADKFDHDVERKIPPDYRSKLVDAFDQLLERFDADEINTGDTLFRLYKSWRDACKVGFNRVDLDRLHAWCREHAAS